MKKGEKKKIDRALKKRAERKRSKRNAVSGAPSAKQIIRQARNYPIEGCWVLQDWQEQGISPVSVARRQPNGNIVFANCLVDFWCLGVKDAFCNADIPAAEFHNEFLAKMFPRKAMSISPALAHEMIYGSIEFAARYGFKPHRDFQLTSYVLDPPEAHPLQGVVEFGKDGQPFYVAGPYDDVEAIMRKLTNAPGGGTPKYLIPLPFDDDDWLADEDELDGDEEDDEFDMDADEVDQDGATQEGAGQTLTTTGRPSLGERIFGKKRGKSA